MADPPPRPPPSPAVPRSAARARGRWTGAGFWARVHLVRHLRRRGIQLAIVGLPLVVVAMRWGFDVPARVVLSMVIVFIVPLLALVMGSGVLREELEDQTLTYAFTRPLDRAAIYMARLAAAFGPALLITLPSVALAVPRPADALPSLLAALLGMLAHVGLFGLFGLVLRRPTWLGLAYILVLEQGLESIPGWLSSLALRTHMRTLAGLPMPPRLPMFGSADPGDPWVSGLALGGVAVVALALAGRFVRRRELVLTK